MGIILNGTTGISTPDVEPTGSTVPTNGVYLPAANSVGIATNSTNAVYINSSQNVGIGTSSPYAVGGSWKGLNVGVGCVQGGSTVSQSTLFLQNSYFNGSSWQRANTGATGGIEIGGGNVIFTNDASGSAGTFTPTERMRIDSNGNLLVGTTSATGRVVSSTTGTYPFVARNGGGTSGYFGLIEFRNNADSAAVGSIVRVNDNSTTYNTSSDYRLKEDWQPMTGASERVKAMNPVNFAWKADGSRVDGFLAHEAQAVVPEAVTGEKDAVDAEGKPVYQGIDQSKLVPLLTAAIKEQQAIIEQQSQAIASLTTRIAALEVK